MITIYLSKSARKKIIKTILTVYFTYLYTNHILHMNIKCALMHTRFSDKQLVLCKTIGIDEYDLSNDLFQTTITRKYNT